MKKSLFIILLVVLFFEMTLFNVNSYRVLNNDSKIEYSKEELEYFETNPAETYIEIKNINTEIKTIHIELDTTENVEYQVLYTDETSSCLRELPRKRYIESYKNSEYIPCYLSGKSQVIAIKLFSDIADFEKVNINEKIPFHFNVARVCILFGIITFIYLLKTREMFKVPFYQKNYGQELVLIMILFVFLLIIGFICKYSVNNLEILDNYCIDFVDALSAGQVHLLEKPSEKLLDLENPYDDGERVSSRLIREQDFLWDVAYYNGKYYMYFGILPAILMLPYHLITGKYIFSAEMVWFFSILSAISLKALIKNVFNRFFKEVPFKFMVFSFIMLLFGSQILWLNGIPRFYELSIISALFFAVTGINFMFYSTEEDGKHKYWYMFIACLMLSLSVACRPTQLLSSIIVVPILLKIFIQNVKEKKDIVKNILAVAVPYLTVGIALMYYNYIRFESVFEFGASYQLTINDMTNLSNRFMTIGMGIICSLFSIPNFIPNFPFMYCHNNLLTFYGFYYIENVMGGLFIMAPICMFIFGIVKVWKRTENKRLLTFTSTLIIVRNCNVFA